MKANEIMIGDFVRIPVSEVDGVTTSNGIAKIISIHSEGCIVKSDVGYTISIDYTLINPIPLTPEILENNGFIEYCDDDIADLAYAQDFHGEVIGIHICGKNGLIDEIYLNYVHELQHAMMLCGIENEIVL